MNTSISCATVVNVRTFHFRRLWHEVAGSTQKGREPKDTRTTPYTAVTGLPSSRLNTEYRGLCNKPPRFGLACEPVGTDPNRGPLTSPTPSRHSWRVACSLLFASSASDMAMACSSSACSTSSCWFRACGVVRVGETTKSKP